MNIYSLSVVHEPNSDSTSKSSCLDSFLGQDLLLRRKSDCVDCTVCHADSLAYQYRDHDAVGELTSIAKDPHPDPISKTR